MDFRGLDPSRIFVLKAGMLMSTGNSPESSSRQILSRENLSRELLFNYY